MVFSGAVSAVLTFILLIVIDMVSFMLLGQSLSRLVFGNSGLGVLIAIGVGAIVGFIVSNRILDRREQARINREIERDRAKYDGGSPPSH
jgi:hypothetical protein